MKSFFNYLLVFLFISVFYACGDDHEGECVECHIALDMNGTEMMWEISNPTGGNEFCEDDGTLADVESPSYVHTIDEDLTCTMGMHTLPAGDYGPGSATNSQYEIHCGEHKED